MLKYLSICAVLTAFGTGSLSAQQEGVLQKVAIPWSAPFGMDRREPVQMATCRACSSSNLAGLLYPSAEWRRLAL